MTALEICQALFGTTSLLLLARSGWLFFKAMEPGWQQRYAGPIEATAPMRLDEVKARAGRCFLFLGVGVGLIGIWTRALSVVFSKGMPIF